MSTVTSHPPHFLTVAEVAALLAVSRSTVYRLVREGELVLAKVHGSSRVPLSSLLAYEGRQVAAATPPHGLPLGGQLWPVGSIGALEYGAGAVVAPEDRWDPEGLA